MELSGSSSVALCKGQLFGSMKEFKDAVQNWAIHDKFTPRVSRSEKARVIFVCHQSDCPFYLRGYWCKEKQSVVLATFKPEHTCFGSASSAKSVSGKHTWLMRVLPSTMVITQDTTPQAIIDAILLKYKEIVDYQAANKARHAFLNDNLLVQARQFQQLPEYFTSLLKSNPGTYYNLSIDPNTQKFRRLFICPPTSQPSFVYCRGLVAIDGTFMKTAFTQILLLAVTVDAENHIELLAWALVESENESSWRYFLSNLKLAIPQVNTLSTTIISDRDKGLQAADNELEFAGRAYCVVHIAANVQKFFGLAARTLFVALTYALTETSFNTGMEKLHETNKKAWEYVNKIDKTLWASPFMSSCRHGHNTSNIVESINATLQSERKMSCIELLDAIWNKYMDRRFYRLKEAISAIEAGEKYTKYSLELLRISLGYVAQKSIQMSTPTNGIVTSFSKKKYIVDLWAGTCTCGRYQEIGIPCGHAIACIIKMKKAPRDYIPDRFLQTTYQSTYTNNVCPVNTSNLSYSMDLLPPQLNRPRGRPKTVRKRTGDWRRSGGQINEEQVNQEMIVQRCTRCKEPGHKRTTCRLPPVLLL